MDKVITGLVYLGMRIEILDQELVVDVVTDKHLQNQNLYMLIFYNLQMYVVIQRNRFMNRSCKYSVLYMILLYSYIHKMHVDFIKHTQFSAYYNFILQYKKQQTNHKTSPVRGDRRSASCHTRHLDIHTYGRTK